MRKLDERETKSILAERARSILDVTFNPKPLLVVARVDRLSAAVPDGQGTVFTTTPPSSAANISASIAASQFLIMISFNLL